MTETNQQPPQARPRPPGRPNTPSGDRPTTITRSSEANRSPSHARTRSTGELHTPVQNQPPEALTRPIETTGPPKHARPKPTGHSHKPDRDHRAARSSPAETNRLPSQARPRSPGRPHKPDQEMTAPPPLTWYVPLPTSAAILCPHTPGTCRRRNHLPSGHEEQLIRRGRTRLLRQRWREGGPVKPPPTQPPMHRRRRSNYCIATFVPSCCTGAVVAVVKIPPGRANSLDREHSLN